MLFLHGLAAFSDEVTPVGGERLRMLLKRLTRPDLRGALMGAFAVMIGANVETTLAAWLVAMNIVGLGAVFVTLGGVWTRIGLCSIPF